MTELTERYLCQLSIHNEAYRTPSLNEKLYLPHKGITSLGNALEKYTELKCLFLEGNALESLRGLTQQAELRCLFLAKNDISSLDGIESLPKLDTLDVTNNNLGSLSGIASLPVLGTLLAGSNRLSELDTVMQDILTGSRSLHTLDLSNNTIDGEPETLVHALAQLPELAAVYLKGNPIVSRVQSYRKRLVAELPGLQYLDDRPVDKKERRAAVAWLHGGLEAEKAERQQARQEEAERHKANIEQLTAIRNAGKQTRLQQDIDDDDDATDNDGVDEGEEEEEEEEEPEELQRARQKLQEVGRSNRLHIEDDEGTQHGFASGTLSALD